MQRYRQARTLILILAGAVVLIAFAILVFHREVPGWRAGGTTGVTPPFVGFDSGSSLCPEDSQTVELRGDSLVLGMRMGRPEQAGSPYGKLAERELGRGIRVVLNGKGGATAASGAASWMGSKAEGQIVLLAYGTNDAAVRGWLSDKDSVQLTSFRESLSEHIRDAQIRGAVVALLAPPPVGSPAMADRLQPYRRAVELTGHEEGISVFDPAEAFAACRDQEPLLTMDALHLNSAGHACLGTWLAQRLCGPTDQTPSEKQQRKPAN